MFGKARHAPGSAGSLRLAPGGRPGGPSPTDALVEERPPSRQWNHVDPVLRRPRLRTRPDYRRRQCAGLHARALSRCAARNRAPDKRSAKRDGLRFAQRAGPRMDRAIAQLSSSRAELAKSAPCDARPRVVGPRWPVSLARRHEINSDARIRSRNKKLDRQARAVREFGAHLYL